MIAAKQNRFSETSRKEFKLFRATEMLPQMLNGSSHTKARKVLPPRQIAILDFEAFRILSSKAT